MFSVYKEKVYVYVIYIGGMCMSVQGRCICPTRGGGERGGDVYVCVQGRCVCQTLGWGKASVYKTGMCVWRSTEMFMSVYKEDV